MQFFFCAHEIFVVVFFNHAQVADKLILFNTVPRTKINELVVFFRVQYSICPIWYALCSVVCGDMQRLKSSMWGHVKKSGMFCLHFLVVGTCKKNIPLYRGGALTYHFFLFIVLYMSHLVRYVKQYVRTCRDYIQLTLQSFFQECVV